MAQIKFEDNSNVILAALKDEVMQRALERIGMQGEGYAKDLCPVDTGRLRNSIGYSVDIAEQTVYIGANTEYAETVETGNSKQQAQPFIKPSVTDHIATYRSIVEDEMQNA